MDPLSVVLSLARVESALFSRAALQGRYAVSTSGGPGAIFHVITEGKGEICCDGQVQPLEAGDFVVLPHGDAHVLRSDAGMLERPIRSLPSVQGEDGLPCVQAGVGEGMTRVLCGSFRFTGEGRALLLPVLPRMLHAAAAGEHGSWMTATARLLASDLDGARPGVHHMAGRLAELLLVHALRGFASSTSANGWLRASADPRLEPALALLHRHPERDWTAERLARAAALSRTTFFERWSAVMGEAPGAYLTRVRMVVARERLRTPLSVAEVAHTVGYQSEAAFSRAFKREVGQSPSEWRQAPQRAA